MLRAGADVERPGEERGVVRVSVAAEVAAMLDIPKGDPAFKREVVLEIKLAEARNWMRLNGVHQLGTEHERQNKDRR